MLEILDLSRNLPCLQLGFTEAAPLHQPLNLHIENPNLVTLLAELITKGAMADNFSQGAPIAKAGNLLPEGIEGGGWPHKQGLEPTREGFRGVFDVV